MSIKLSDTQRSALTEVSELGYTVAKANTIKSLETKGLIEATSNTHHKLTKDGREFLGLPSEEDVSVEASFLHITDAELEAAESVDDARLERQKEAFNELRDLLDGDPWELGARIEEETHEAYQAIAQADVFDSSWADWEKELAGFGETLKWEGTEVWDGLTAEEIREDMDTAYPVGRQARRVHHRTLRNAFRRMAVKASPQSRKSTKVTGARTESLSVTSL